MVYSDYGPDRETGAVCDYRMYDRIWQRVSPDLNPYPHIRDGGEDEITPPEVGGKPLAFVGDGRRGALEDTPHGHPVAEPVKTVFGGFHFELPAGIFRADERGRLALRIGEHPARVLELTPRSDTFERVGGRCKIFHLYAFV